MLKNKKGLGLGIDDWGAWIVFPFIILIFFLLFKFTLGQFQFDITGTSKSPENFISLLNILKSPITVNGQTISVSDLIVLSVAEEDFDIKENYVKQLEEEIKKLLDSTFSTDKCYAVWIDKRRFPSSNCVAPPSELPELNILIPNPLEKEKVIDVRFEIETNENLK